jgi:adenylate cyclase
VAIEIERKFLVEGQEWLSGVSTSQGIRQFYLCHDKDASIRVRIADGRLAWLTIKSAAAGLGRLEFEYAVPIEDAIAMTPLAQGHIVDKVRHHVLLEGVCWEVDVFGGDNSGLVVAELELSSEDQAVVLPDWIGAEVTDDPRYQNASLAIRPYARWTSAD